MGDHRYVSQRMGRVAPPAAAFGVAARSRGGSVESIGHALTEGAPLHPAYTFNSIDRMSTVHALTEGAPLHPAGSGELLVGLAQTPGLGLQPVPDALARDRIELALQVGHAVVAVPEAH